MGPTILNRALSNCLTKWVTFEQKLKEKRELRLEDIWGKSILNRRKWCESPEVGTWWLIEDKGGGWWGAEQEKGVGEAQGRGGGLGAALTQTLSATRCRWRMFISLAYASMGSLDCCVKKRLWNSEVLGGCCSGSHPGLDHPRWLNWRVWEVAGF